MAALPLGVLFPLRFSITMLIPLGGINITSNITSKPLPYTIETYLLYGKNYEARSERNVNKWYMSPKAHFISFVKVTDYVRPFQMNICLHKSCTDSITSKLYFYQRQRANLVHCQLRWTIFCQDAVSSRSLLKHISVSNGLTKITKSDKSHIYLSKRVLL